MRFSKNSFLNNIPPDNIRLTLNREPFIQSQSPFWSIKNIFFNDYDLFICTAGKAIFTLEGKDYVLEEGMAFLAPPGKEINARHGGGQNFEATAQHFNLSIFAGLDFFSFIRLKPMAIFSNWEIVKPLTQKYDNLFFAGRSHFLRYSIFYLILMEFITDAFIEDKAGDENYEFILDVLQYIHENINETDVVEKAFAISPYAHSYTSILFRKHVGISPKRYLITARLKHGKDMLRQGRKVKDAASKSGFNDELYFSRLFKKYEGISPREYRTMTQNGI